MEVEWQTQRQRRRNRNGGYPNAAKLAEDNVPPAAVSHRAALATAADNSGFVAFMVTRRHNSWVEELDCDPDAAAGSNQQMREVRSGHYVPVPPKTLAEPQLVVHSPEVAADLGLTQEMCQGPDFLRFFSGDNSAVDGTTSWATPYALSIYGEFQHNDQLNLYGDGRAISLSELRMENGDRWELQLKGAGRTPFCRGADGRAVLRSSLREFIASEAMHHLGVGTTRALSLVVSQRERVRRSHPWKRGSQMERCAITCRVAPSFLRIGHFELFGRRAGSHEVGCPEAAPQLLALVRHALRREFGEMPGGDAASMCWRLLRLTSARLAQLTADWLRVGFCQGNFNSDNCLLSGRTMDYGPFGWVEEFNPRWGPWTGGGTHFAFMNQPTAGLMNLKSLFEALLPMMDLSDDAAAWDQLQQEHTQASMDRQNDVFRRKLGLRDWSSEAAGVLSDLLGAMEASGADYTTTFRELARLVQPLREPCSDEELMNMLRLPSLPCAKTDLSRWSGVVSRWRNLVQLEGSDPEEVAAQMRRTSPKYVPREWMLKEAYVAAETGDYAPLEELFDLLKYPYLEQPHHEIKYYKMGVAQRMS